MVEASLRESGDERIGQKIHVPLPAGCSTQNLLERAASPARIGGSKATGAISSVLMPDVDDDLPRGCEHTGSVTLPEVAKTMVNRGLDAVPYSERSHARTGARGGHR